MNAESSLALLAGSMPLIEGGMVFASDWLLPANEALIPPDLVAGVGRVGPVPVMFVVPSPVPPPGWEYPPPPLVVPGGTWEEAWLTLPLGYEWETDDDRKFRKTGPWAYVELP